MQEVYLLLNFCLFFSLLICLLLQELSAKNQEGQRENSFSSPTMSQADLKEGWVLEG